MQELQERIKPFNISLDLKAINEPLSQAILTTISHLQKKRNDRGSSVKALSNIFIMQLDIASSIGKDDVLKRERDKKLKALGLEPESDTEIENEFWQDEALSLKRLLEEVPVEKLHLMTFEIELKDKPNKLGLNLNKNKTEHYGNISDFFPSIELDTDLDKLNEKFNQMLYPLWIMNYDYRTQFELANSSHDEKSWWKLIKIYQHCLYSLGIHIIGKL